MRTGAGSAVQQTLTTEAASVLKHSLSLARRRGHAQVTPLHVAAILLSSRVSLLRRACLKSQPNYSSHHPLQCRALELCFNVALNRLPTSPGPLLHGQPCLSNALIAALKRAQAHQRRGCIEQQQQQPLLAIKVELDQLILSILDDPSVSRVMREAGFSSTVIKTNIEESANSSVFQCYNNSSSSGGIYSTPSSPPTINSFLNSHQNPILFSPHKFNTLTASSSDVKLVIDVLVNKRRNSVIVGDSGTEGVVEELMGKVERGDVPEELKEVHFIKFQFSSAPLMLMKREEVELNISDLKRKVESLTGSRGGVIIYTGDLKWTVDQSLIAKTSFVNNYSPVDHLVAEIGRLVSCSNAKVWLVGTANYQTYMKCQMKQPPLDIQWSLQPISLPSGGLGLSLNSTSVYEPRIPFSQQMFEKKPIPSKEEQDAVTCCAECTSNYEREARLKFGQHKNSTLYSITCDTKDSDKGLPDWLKPHDIDTTNKDDVAELKRKWSRLCKNLHQGKPNQRQTSSVLCNEYNSSGKNYSYNSLYPWWPNKNSIITDSKSISFSDPPNLKPNQGASTVPRFRRQQSCHIEFSFSNGNSKIEPNLDSLKIREGKEVKITLALGNSQLSDIGNVDEEMIKMLQENLPWQMENMDAIVDALMDFRTMKKQKNWLVIQGNDSIGKQRLARVIAKSAFGSDDLLLCIDMRKRENMSHVELLNKSLRNNEKLVVLVEDIDFADSDLLKFLIDAYENGSSSHLFILARTSDATDHFNDGKEYYKESVIQMKLMVSKRSVMNPGSVCIDHKRKAEWELSLPNKTKSPRNNVMEDVSSNIAAQNGKMKKEFTRQLSSNTLDLNIKADEVDEEEDDEDDENEVKTEDFSPISSDLTRDTAIDQQNPPLGLFDLIKNRLVLKRDSFQDKRMREVFMFKMRRSLEEVCGSKKIVESFCLEEMVLEKVFEGCRSFLNSLFDEWLKDIFQTSLQMVEEKENVIIKLCTDMVGANDHESGFKGSCLPRGIQVSIMQD
ncbi:protein SMAX1-LIKE 4-like [Lycium barbarum]|uniref:protein SMAX1-LIKE 4-like n=1 Tax=Lycium barbarum TaxID=112863 RepID=UPI00293E8F8D|nr:protein SMAX1-LIKE 4-like [Lycium barbarum]